MKLDDESRKPRSSEEESERQKGTHRGMEENVVAGEPVEEGRDPEARGSGESCHRR